jgi:hypothetical protein
MARKELSISVSYIPRWSKREGIREILTNADDARRENHATFRVRHQGTKLFVENEGTTLDPSVLLMGQTTKYGNSEMIGQFGEGLKLACLALLRQGCTIKIITGDESWTPSIEASENFGGKDVLVFRTHKRQTHENAVRFEIDGISKTEWAEWKNDFLFLNKMTPEQRVQTSDGALLLGKAYVGRIYLKGTFVEYDEAFAFGYDLSNGEVDRDRKMVDRYDLRRYTRLIWTNAVATRPDLIKDFIGLLEESKADLDGIDTYNAHQLSADVMAAVSAKFKTQFGDDSVPVQSLSESADIEHLGKRGIVVAKPLGAILARDMGTVSEIKEKLRLETVRLYSWHDLTSEEQKNLREGIALIAAAGFGLTLDSMDVADFRDEKTLGIRDSNGRTQLAKKILADASQTLLALVHEYAHEKGGDGSKAHVARIEEIWAGVVATLRASKIC